MPVALGEVGVVDVGLVHPDGVARHDPVLVAGHRGEHAVPPLEGRLVGDAAQLGRALDGDVVAYEPDEGDPGGAGLAAVIEDGAGEGAVPPAAAGAAPRAFWVRPIGRGGLVATATHIRGLSEQQELVGDEARHECPEGVSTSHIELSHLQVRPSGGIGAKQRSGWAFSQITCLLGNA